MRTLLLDGDWNLKRNFMKRTDLFAKGEHCGGSFGFLESLRSVVNKIMPDRVVVMWDGMMGGKLRHDLYPQYKQSRNKSWDEDSYRMDDVAIGEEERRKYSTLQQKIKVKNYLEELFIRQLEVDYAEGDDLIALYVNNKDQDEEVIIFSSDKDYYQLIDEKVSVLRPSDNKIINNSNFKEIFGFTKDNALVLRCFEGDNSDDITGVDGVAYKTIIKYFPRFIDEYYSVDRFIEESVQLYQTKKIKFFEKIIGCRKTFERNKKLMDLRNPLVEQKASEEVNDIKTCIIVEDEGYSQRSIQNAIRMLHTDGYNRLVWNENVEFFFQPFYRLVAKEKEYTKKVLKG